MEQDAIIPVDLDAYRRRLDTLGAQRVSAVRRVELTTDVLRGAIRAAVDAGISQAEASRLSGVPRKTVREWLGLT